MSHFVDGTCVSLVDKILGSDTYQIIYTNPNYTLGRKGGESTRNELSRVCRMERIGWLVRAVLMECECAVKGQAAPVCPVPLIFALFHLLTSPMTSELRHKSTLVKFADFNVFYKKFHSTFLSSFFTEGLIFIYFFTKMFSFSGYRVLLKFLTGYLVQVSKHFFL